MRLLKVFLGLVVILILVLVLLKNADIVTVKLFFKTYENVPLAVVIVVVLGVGIMIGFAIALSSIVSSKAETRILKGENKRLTDELNSLRNVAIDEGIYEVIEGEE